MELKYKKLVPEAQTPYRKYDVDAGFDLVAISKEETNDYVEYKTGIAFEIPEGYVGLVFPRSSVTTYDLILKNCVGVIDASYRGEIRFRFYGTNDRISYNKGIITIIKYDGKLYDVGDRVGQIVFIKIPEITLVETQELSDTDRGTGGFGHTGK